MTDDCELLCLDLPQARAIRSTLPDLHLAQERADVAKAMSDPTRLRIATALAVGDELCVYDLSWVCELAQNLVSHHVRALRQAGAATSRRDGKMVLCRLTDVGHAVLDAVLPEIVSAHAPRRPASGAAAASRPPQAEPSEPRRASQPRKRAIPESERVPAQPRRNTTRGRSRTPGPA